MRIAIVLDVENRSGAAVAAERPIQGLTRQGHTVTTFVRRSSGSSRRKGVVQQPRGKLLRLASNVGPQYTRDRAESTATMNWLRTSLEAYRPDVINIHSCVMTTHGSIPFAATELCYRIAPTVWTLHDMWSFTGRCIYSLDCRKFITGCDSSCPTSNEFPVLPPNRIRGEWLERQEILDRCPRLAAIAPSRWLAQEARAGLWKQHRVEHIPYGIPLEVFQPFPRDTARQMLGIEATGPVVLCGAWALDEKRKGLELAVAALRNSQEKFTLVSMGRGVVRWDRGPYFSAGRGGRRPAESHRVQLGRSLCPRGPGRQSAEHGPGVDGLWNAGSGIPHWGTPRHGPSGSFGVAERRSEFRRPERCLGPGFPGIEAGADFA
jgi:glycosyltransferase involved in cell wall biosynthesis